MAKQLNIPKIKVKLQLTDQFLACIAVMSEWIKRDDIDTCATDGANIFYNEDFLRSLDINEQVGVIAHECMHIALQHALRADAYKDTIKHLIKWNIACDMVINYALRKAGFDLPAGAVEMVRDWKTEPAEKIYEYLDDNAEDNICYVSLPLSNDIKPNENEESQEQIKHKAIDIITQATIIGDCKSFSEGLMGECKRMLDKLVNPKLPWYTILKNYINDTIQEDYSWAKPNRRYTDIYLPSICDTEALNECNVYIDVSGSIELGQIIQFLSECKFIHRALSLRHMHIAFFSSQILTRCDIDSSWITPPDPDTDYGTNIEPVIDDINKKGSTVSVIFTDGIFAQDSINLLKYPVIWCVFDNDRFKPSKGKTIAIDMS